MFNLLGFFFILIIAVLVIGVSIVGSILRALFVFGRQQNSQRREQEEESVAEDDFQPRRHKKIFAKDEGEYVDFEEIK